MKILISTEPDDTHALYVKLALESIGYTCDFWFTADMPTLQTNNIYVSNELFQWFLESKPNQS